LERARWTTRLATSLNGGAGRKERQGTVFPRLRMVGLLNKRNPIFVHADLQGLQKIGYAHWSEGQMRRRKSLGRAGRKRNRTPRPGTLPYRLRNVETLSRKGIAKNETVGEGMASKVRVNNRNPSSSSWPRCPGPKTRQLKQTQISEIFEE